MTKNSKGRKRRKNSKHYDSDHDNDDESPDQTENRSTDNKSTKSKCRNKKSDLSFAERRELQRKAAADKRRQKMKCYLCGKTGHVRRECPGIDDDGRGESKFTKAKGDSGAVQLKNSNRGRKKHNHNGNHDTRGTHLALPDGFDKTSASFFYYDAGYTEGQDILDYLRFGRHGHGCGGNSGHGNNHNHTQVSRKDAIEEYDVAMKDVFETTNFGGCILRSYLQTPKTSTTPSNDEEPWRPRDSFPFSCFNDIPSFLKFVVGYPLDDETDLNCHGNSSTEMVDALVKTANNHKEDIVGFFADLDYTALVPESEEGASSKQSSREFQLKRLRSTLQAASKLDCPVQIRISPGYNKTTQQPSSMDGEHSTANAPIDGYALAIRDLGEILLEASVESWKVHLSSWNGKAEHLVALSGAFASKSATNRLVFGFNGSLGFSKAIHLHESAFEVSPLSVVVETSGPGMVPPIIAKHGGRNAFCHSGHIPYVAEELAKRLGKNPKNVDIVCAQDNSNDRMGTGEISAEEVARLASTTTMALYGLQ